MECAITSISDNVKRIFSIAVCVGWHILLFFPYLKILKVTHTCVRGLQLKKLVLHSMVKMSSPSLSCLCTRSIAVPKLLPLHPTVVRPAAEASWEKETFVQALWASIGPALEVKAGAGSALCHFYDASIGGTPILPTLARIGSGPHTHYQ